MWNRALTWHQLIQNQPEICSDCLQSAAKQQLPPVKFLVCVTNVAIKSFSDPGGQLRVAARRPESTIVNPDGGRSQLLQCDRGGANWGEGGCPANEGPEQPKLD